MIPKAKAAQIAMISRAIPAIKAALRCDILSVSNNSMLTYYLLFMRL